MIEEPIEEFQLNSDSMNALMGGSTCGVRVNNTCFEYKTSSTCDGPENYCKKFTWGDITV